MNLVHNTRIGAYFMWSSLQRMDIEPAQPQQDLVFWFFDLLIVLH